MRDGQNIWIVEKCIVYDDDNIENFKTYKIVVGNDALKKVYNQYNNSDLRQCKTSSFTSVTKNRNDFYMQLAFLGSNKDYRTLISIAFAGKVNKNYFVHFPQEYTEFWNGVEGTSLEVTKESFYSLDYKDFVTNFATRMLVENTSFFRNIGNFLLKYKPTKTLVLKNGSVYCAIEQGMFKMKLYKVI